MRTLNLSVIYCASDEFSNESMNYLSFLIITAGSLISFVIPYQQALASEPLRPLVNGTASWYGKKFHGRKTASGEIYDMNKLTCAHRTLPFGTTLLLHNPQNDKTCLAVVNDRGPFDKNRILDVSKAVAIKLGITGLGKIVGYSMKNLVRGVTDSVHLAKRLINNNCNNSVPTNDQIASAESSSDIAEQNQIKEQILDEVITGLEEAP